MTARNMRTIGKAAMAEAPAPIRATVRATAGQAARWPLRRQDRKTLARWWGVSPSRVSHRIADGTNPLAEILALVEHPAMDGPAIVAAVLEALERRYLAEAREDRAACEERLAYLLSREHDMEAAQNRALQTGEGIEDALLSHGSGLIEIAARMRALGKLGDD